MFFHIYSNRIKCILRDKEILFWTLLFPLLLATLFNMAFSNISSGEIFNAIDIAVVENDAYKNDTAFRSALESVSSGEDRLFNADHTTLDKADKLLNDNKISGYIYLDKNGVNLVVKSSGINQSIIKAFLDDYKQTASTVVTILSVDPAKYDQIIQDLSVRADYLDDFQIGRTVPDPMVNYFYTLIAMTCFYGAFWGLKEVVAVQADLSALGARVSIAPTHKLKVLSVSLLAASTIQFIELLILLAYLIFVLGIDFGSQLAYVILTCLVGTLAGVSFGAMITTVVKGGEGIKVGIIISASMLMSFLAGMMYANMKYIISANAPVLSYLNPVNLLADSFYSLYYYTSYTQFFTNLSLLGGYIVVFALTAYFVLRRQKYASI